VALIKGGISTEERKFSIRSLKKSKVDVLICTEAGSEGLNMQFCHNLINYDLPWNPMKIEQRIGRIHRIGQEYDVNIYNLAVKGTIEEYILNRLYEKIDLFHTAIGELADILTRIMDEESFEKTLFEILMKNRKKIDIQKQMDELMEKMKYSKEFQENVNKLDDVTLGLFNLFNAILIVALSLLVHISVQRIWALGTGYRLEWRMWSFGLLLGLILVFLTNGKFWLIVPGGFIVHHIQNIPKVNDRVEILNYQFTITSVEKTHIDKVYMEILDKDAD
ncbi:MAG: hypothetical protein IH948_06370, partial [Bacteroidetes bacterium]|nr:hypothetical protein [Bacteroidota bacterium]